MFACRRISLSLLGLTGGEDKSISRFNSSYRSCSRRWKADPSKSPRLNLSLEFESSLPRICLKSSKDPSDTFRGIRLDTRFIFDNLDFFDRWRVILLHSSGLSRKNWMLWYAPFWGPFWILSNPQRFNWRWKDLYFVCLKNNGRISLTKTWTLWTLKAFPRDTHDTILSLFSVVHTCNITCNFRGKSRVSAPREVLLVVQRSISKMASLLALDGRVSIMLRIVVWQVWWWERSSSDDIMYDTFLCQR